MFASMILDCFNIKFIEELKELFQKPSYVEDIMISETMLGCNMIEYNFSKIMFLILDENLQRLEMLDILIIQKGFGK